MNVKNKIAVTVITGFLGAGKTTFINNLLKNNPGIQFALVENEFGDISIDTKLIKGLDASQMFELKQGCICCTISDEYELVLLELAERFPNVAHLLIETTGIADPVPVIRPFFINENLQKLYAYKGTICLVDALNFFSQPEKEISLKQIAVTDLVLINKSEDFSEKQKEKIKNYIFQINPLGDVQFSEFGNSPEFKLDLFMPINKFLPVFSTIKPVHSKITSQTLTFKHPLKREKFTEWLSYNLDIYRNEMYRVKGILCFENEPYEFILQGVGGSFEMNEGEELVKDEKSEMVFIGNLGDLNLSFENE